MLAIISRNFIPKLLLIIFLSFTYNLSYGQVTLECAFENGHLPHINKSGIEIVLTNPDIPDSLDYYKDLHDNAKFDSNSQFKISKIGHTQSSLKISMDIDNDASLVTTPNKPRGFDIKTNESQILARFEIPIGSDKPSINVNGAKGELFTKLPPGSITIYGQNLNGVKKILTIPDLSPEIIDSDRTDDSCSLKLTPGLVTSKKVQMAMVFFRYDIKDNILIRDTTPFEATDIEVSSFHRLDVGHSHVYSDEISSSKQLDLTLKGDFIGLEKGKLNANSEEQIVNNINIISVNDSEMELKIQLIESVSIENMKTLKLSVTNSDSTKLFFSELSIYPTPEITEVTNTTQKSSNFIISKDLYQNFEIEGKNLDYIEIDSLQDGFEVFTQKNHKYKMVITKHFEPGTKSLKYRYGDGATIKGEGIFQIEFINPTIPQPLNQLIKIQRLTQKTNPKDQSSEIDKVTYKAETEEYDPLNLRGHMFEIKNYGPKNGLRIILVDTNANDGFGDQSINVKVTYYSSSGEVLFTENVRGYDDSKDIKLGPGQDAIPYDVTNNNNDKADYILDWGHCVFEVSHSTDFYEQKTHKRQMNYKFTIFFKGKHTTQATASFTAPPALIYYGTDEAKNELGGLPLNVGGGISISGKSKKNSYRDSDFSGGFYFAGLNFAGPNFSSPEAADSSVFINKGDFGAMLLFQYNVRKKNDQVKVPVTIGAIYTIPTNIGQTSKLAFVLGLGIMIDP
jgi:hypothetical protein